MNAREDSPTPEILSSNTIDQVAYERNKRIGRGMNFGNALEAPNEGDWGFVIRESYVEAIAQAGFDSIRIPIRWSAHVSDAAPYTIDPDFLDRIDEVVGWCMDRNLLAIITIHHFEELYDDPDDPVNQNKILAIWDQLTHHYLTYDHDQLIFEPLNEPHNNLTSAKWNALMPTLIRAVRQTDTDRTLIIDVSNWAHHIYLKDLIIPEEERNVIVSVRYYLPYPFTHQGGHWAEGSEAWLGTTWRATEEETAVVRADMEMIRNWSESHHRPITVGEFGAIVDADHESRVIWTDYVRSQFEENGFSWCYFDFGYIFKAYDIDNNNWLPGFKEALVP